MHKTINKTLLILTLVLVETVGLSFFVYDAYLCGSEAKIISNISVLKKEARVAERAVAAENQVEESKAIQSESSISEENVHPMQFVEVSNNEIAADQNEKTQAAILAKKIAAGKARQQAIINSAPVLSGSTHRLPNNLRICPVHSDHPQRGGRIHTDEDCCADYNEYPNPRCYYPPDEWAILKH